MSQEPTKAHGDHQSDPARTPGDGWVGEGGASHLGPATHTGQELKDEDAHARDNTDAGADGEGESDDE